MIVVRFCNGKLTFNCISTEQVVENVNWLELAQHRIGWLALC